MSGKERGVVCKPLLPLPLERYCSVDEFNPKEFRFTVLKPTGRNSKKKQKIVDEVFAFDIETTGIAEIQQSVMYIWQFQIGTRLTVFGRTWEEFLWFLIKLRSCIPRGAKAIVYVFNLSYEWQFLKGIYDFTTEDVFPIDRRKILYCRMFDCLEFRCAYLQTNMSLKKFTEKMNIPHKKLDDFDYGIPRFSWSQLTVEELRYCQNDVLGLVEAIKEEMTRDGDTLLTIPYTSTGYVRREFKQALKDAGYFYRWAWDFFPSPKLYDIMRKAFRGGDTHGNRWYADRILHNVHSFDRSSSYPDVICNCDFPITPFEWVKVDSIDRIREVIKNHKRAFLMRLRFSGGVKLNSEYWGSPYLSRDKSEKIKNGVFYNGRILEADSLELCITDIDLKIIDAEYTIGKIEVLDCYKSTYGKLPQCMIDLTIEYYRKKTELKGIDKYQYDKSKAKLNAIYGMTAQKPISIPILYNAEEKEFYYDMDADINAMFEEQKKHYWLPYQIGIYTTALARYELFLGVQNVAMSTGCSIDEFSDFVYCDTDSVKFIGNADFTEYNETRKARSIASGAYATDPKGKTHYMGVFEEESDYSEFKHLGAKKYAGIVRDNLEVTIAGVNKKLGAVELNKHGGLDALETGFTFHEAGGLNAQYNDLPAVDKWTVDGHELTITSNVYLYPSEYTVGDTADFIRLLYVNQKDIDITWKSLYNEICGDDSADQLPL